jgi:hypothetical protein
VIDNFFDLLLLFSIDYVQWGLGEVGPMARGLSVRGQKRGMEDVVYMPVVWQF